MGGIISLKQQLLMMPNWKGKSCRCNFRHEENETGKVFLPPDFLFQILAVPGNVNVK